MYPCNGAWGAIAVNGTIQADFYVERVAAPEEIAHRIEAGVVGPEERLPAEEGEKRIERQVQFGLLLTPESARAIGQWLLGKVDEYEKLVGVQESATEADAVTDESNNVVAG
jgi:hypothetical protein